MRGRTGFATPAGDAFADDDWQHAKGGNWIGPPPAQYGIGEQTDQQRDREIGADLVLRRLAARAGPLI